MGSLARRKKSGILLTVVTTIFLVGLLSPPVSASESVEQHKVRILETLGLNGTDPAVARAAREACTLHAVDVVPGNGGVSVALRLSGQTTYKTAFSKEENRFIVDLENTVDLAPSPVSPAGKGDWVKNVRNSQFKVSPTIISRVVVDLTNGAAPEVRSEGNDLIICTPTSASVAKDEASEEAPAQQQKVPSRVVSVPAVNVNTESPKLDYMFAKVAAPVDTSANKTKTEQPGGTVANAGKRETSKPLAMVTALLKQPEAEASQEQTPATAPDSEQSEPAQTAAAPSQEPAAEPVAVAEPPAPTQVAAAPTQEAAPPAQKDDAPPAEPAASEPPASPAQPEGQAAAVPPPLEEGVQVRPTNKTQPTTLSSRIEVKPTSKSESPDGNLVSLNFRDADLGAVLDILARKGNFNVLAGKDVRGTVTVRLTDVPLEVALNAILNVNGYGFMKMDNIIRIVPLSQLGKEVVTTTETYMLSYATAKKAKETLQGFLTKNGSIQIDERTNMLIVTDTPGNMDRVRALIPEIDRRVEQVLIEVLILDSVLSDASDLGVQWTLFDRSTQTVDQVPSTGSSVVSTQKAGSRVNLPVTADALKLSFAALMGDFKLDAFIQAQVDNNHSRILANPKILTVNNETANIEIVEEFPYSDVTQTSSGGQLSNITFKEIGTKLAVKPQITHDGHVILRIKPEQNFPAGSTPTGVPIVDTRRAETTLIVKDSQTIVLGGLRLDRKLKEIVKVPVLGDLPGIKYIFRSVDSSDSDTELLVFITVHIIESNPLLPDEKLKFGELANMPRNPSTSIDLVR